MGQQISTTISDSRKALLVLLCKLGYFAVCWGFKLCLAIIYKLKEVKRGENFGNIASISQTHLFHKFYIHISLSTHTSGSIAKPVAFYWFVLLSEVLNSIFGSVLRLKKRKKWPKSGKIEPVYPATTFHKIYIDISLCMGYPAGERLVPGGSFAFKLYAINSLGTFKGPKFYGST